MNISPLRLALIDRQTEQMLLQGLADDFVEQSGHLRDSVDVSERTAREPTPAGWMRKASWGAFAVSAVNWSYLLTRSQFSEPIAILAVGGAVGGAAFLMMEHQFRVTRESTWRGHAQRESQALLSQAATLRAQAETVFKSTDALRIACATNQGGGGQIQVGNGVLTMGGVRLKRRYPV